jgi:hypothetical protein
MKRLGNKAIKSDEMQGVIDGTNSSIEVGTLRLELDRDTAWALCNVLSKNHIENECVMQLDKNQYNSLIKLGSAIGAFIDHSNREFDHLK